MPSVPTSPRVYSTITKKALPITLLALGGVSAASAAPEHSTNTQTTAQRDGRPQLKTLPPDTNWVTEPGRPAPRSVNSEARVAYLKHLLQTDFRNGLTSPALTDARMLQGNGSCNVNLGFNAHISSMTERVKVDCSYPNNFFGFAVFYIDGWSSAQEISERSYGFSASATDGCQRGTTNDDNIALYLSYGTSAYSYGPAHSSAC